MIKTCRCGKEYEAGEGIMLFPVCKSCADEWDKEIEAMQKRDIESVDENELLDKLGIRTRHYDCTFDNFIIRTEKDNQAVNMCRRMAKSRRGILVLIGNNGTGKTHLLSAAAREIGSGKIFKMLEVGMFIRKYIGSTTLDEQGQLDYLVRLPFLAIDEFDKCKRSESELNWLSYIIDERNERNRATMLSGNCHPEKSHAGSRCERCFESIVTPDILDRISQSGAIHYFDGESYRRELRGKE